MVDAHLPKMDGIALLTEIRARRMPVPVILTSETATIPLAAQAMKAGAFYFLDKTADRGLLLDQISRALAFSIQLARVDEARKEALRRLSLLTEREAEVFKLVVTGLTSKEIARHLYRSEKTIHIHRAHIHEKLSARGIASLVAIARDAQLEVVKPDDQVADG